MPITGPGFRFSPRYTVSPVARTPFGAFAFPVNSKTRHANPWQQVMLRRVTLWRTTMAISIRTLQRRFERGELELEPPTAVLYVNQDGERIAVSPQPERGRPIDELPENAWIESPLQYGYKSKWLALTQLALMEEGTPLAAAMLAHLPVCYAAEFPERMKREHRLQWGDAAAESVERGVGLAYARKRAFFGLVVSPPDPENPWAKVLAEELPRDDYMRVTPHEYKGWKGWKMVPGATSRSHAFARNLDATTPRLMDVYWMDQVAKMREYGVPNFQHERDGEFK